jgi:hypothetical protein
MVLIRSNFSSTLAWKQEMGLAAGAKVPLDVGIEHYTTVAQPTLLLLLNQMCFLRRNGLRACLFQLVF